MEGYTRRRALGVLLCSAALPRAAWAQQAFTPDAFVAVVDLVCGAVDAMDNNLAGVGSPPSPEQAVATMSLLFDNLPTLFAWMQAIADSTIPEPGPADLDRIAQAVARARRCNDRYEKIAEKWSKTFGPDLGAGSGQGTVDAGAWMRQKVQVDWHWAAVKTLAAVLLLRFGRR